MRELVGHMDLYSCVYTVFIFCILYIKKYLMRVHSTFFLVFLHHQIFHFCLFFMCACVIRSCACAGPRCVVRSCGLYGVRSEDRERGVCGVTALCGGSGRGCCLASSSSLHPHYNIRHITLKYSTYNWHALFYGLMPANTQSHGPPPLTSGVPVCTRLVGRTQSTRSPPRRDGTPCARPRPSAA